MLIRQPLSDSPHPRPFMAPRRLARSAHGGLLALAALACTFAWSLAAAGRAENWPQWRGPRGTGVSAAADVPVFWNTDRNVHWKCPLPAWGTSTPAVWDDAVFVTSHTDDDRLLLLRIDRRAGRIEWTREVGRAQAPREAPKRSTQKFHRLHNLASPSPVTDGQTVVAHFGNGDLAAYDFAGNQLWKRNLQDDYGTYSIWWGHANSPVLHDGLVISVCMQDSLADQGGSPVESYLVAHDLRDGHVAWKTPRMTGADAEQCDAYTTPLLVQQGNAWQLVVMGGNQLDAYDPATGKQLWYLPGLVGGRTVTGPTAAGGLLYATRGMRGPLIAARLGAPAEGELDRRAIEWQYDQGTPDTCCPVVVDDLLFMVTDDGIARCLDAATGHLQWKQRLQGSYKASPIAADGRVFFLNTSGTCTVVSAARRFDKLTENQLDDETIASPAVAGSQIFLRGRDALYCIGRPAAEATP